MVLNVNLNTVQTYLSKINAYLSDKKKKIMSESVPLHVA